MPRAALLSGVMSLVCAAIAAAQPAPAQTPPGGAAVDRLAQLPDCQQEAFGREGNRWQYRGNVECQLPDGVRLSADAVDVLLEDDRARILARGNVAFAGAEGQFGADTLDYDTATGTGVFEHVAGTLTLPARGGAMFTAGEPVVYFFAQRLERLGPRRYRMTKGTFSTCEQPAPRWEFVAGSTVLNLDDYVVARHTVFRVKQVPLFYVPYFYYPIQSDDRATGFLMPSYGASTFRGQAISNAFFWEIGRSHDATFLHDWFTRAGQGAGVEYRYVTGALSSGTFRAYRFWQSATETTENGTVTVLPASTSYEMTGTAVQGFGSRITGRARVDYFSDVVSQQLLHQDVYAASRRNRLIEGAVTASAGPATLTGQYQRNEVVNTLSDTALSGSTPRVTASLASQRLFDSPVYASATGEYAFLPYRRYVDGALSSDDSFARVDIAPTVRAPLSRLTFLSVNASASYRGTYYTRQAGADPAVRLTDPGSYLRQFGTARAEVIGPVFNRIWDLPEDSFAQRLKHVVEPAFTMDVTTPIRDYQRTPVLSDPADFVVGGNARLTYGITNRLFTRSGGGEGGRGATTREILTVGVQQTRYSQPEASRYDGTYVSTQGTGAGRPLSPVAMTLRASPSALVDANARLEYDVYGNGLRTITTGATLNGARHGLTLNFSRQRFDASSPVTSFASSSVRTKLLEDRLSATYSINWDVARGYAVSHGVVAAYMAQCCGIQGEYQQFNYPANIGVPITTDRRINVSLVLAGLGTFSNFFGAFGGL